MKTDSQLQHDVSAALQVEPSVHAARIGVAVKDGIVSLDGQVDSHAEKWTAERAAQHVAGVQAMRTGLTAHLPGPSQRTDADIAQSAENVLAWTASLPAGTLQVMVERGWVTLSGDVDGNGQRQAVIDSVRNLMGVTGISDAMRSMPAVAATAVQSDTDAACSTRTSSC